MSARVLCSECRRKEIEEVAGFSASLFPIRCRRREQVGFQFVLPKAQCLLVRLDVRQQPTKIRSFLGGHSAMLVKVDRLGRLA